MKKTNVRLIAVNAIIAAVYAALTLAIQPLAYGEVQFRFTEILVFLAFYDYRYFPGLIIGCFLANLASPMLVYDLPFGTMGTVLACFGMYGVRKLIPNEKIALFTAAVPGALANGIMVGIALHLAYELPYLSASLYVAAGEFAVLILGAVIFLSISQIPDVRKCLHFKF